MNCLIDSHVFLWAIFSPERLSRRATEIILNPDSTVAVSVVTFWELSLKFALGKLELNGVTPDLFPGAAKDAGFDILSVRSNS
jgi:PIN domain nuclease of toxin-antitoxin system